MSLPSNLALNSVVHLHTLSVDLAANLLTEPVSLDGPSSWHNLQLPAFAAARRQSSSLSFATATSSSHTSLNVPPRCHTAAAAASPPRVLSAQRVARTKRSARQHAARSRGEARAQQAAPVPTSPVSDVTARDARKHTSGALSYNGSAPSVCSAPSSQSSSSCSARSQSPCHGAQAAPRRHTHAHTHSMQQQQQQQQQQHTAAAATLSLDAAHDVVSGTLRKRTRLTRRWVSRHFVLCGDTLYNLRDAQRQPTWRLPLSGAEVGTDRNKRLIRVWARQQRPLELVADDELALRRWGEALLHATQRAERSGGGSACSGGGAPRCAHYVEARAEM
eukprot:TRINITY_DN914_c1_g1_i2.p4 TRINITY_DN914_c1_g1~~TRINITY_DN914_c1_g1_i2.p4  ORF type:complete len:333 (+),score=98.07 TRINITY_DN914_c1_g1_i2:819-1817(+)